MHSVDTYFSIRYNCPHFLQYTKLFLLLLLSADKLDESSSPSVFLTIPHWYWFWEKWVVFMCFLFELVILIGGLSKVMNWLNGWITVLARWRETKRGKRLRWWWLWCRMRQGILMEDDTNWMSLFYGIDELVFLQCDLQLPLGLATRKTFLPFLIASLFF